MRYIVTAILILVATVASAVEPISIQSLLRNLPKEISPGSTTRVPVVTGGILRQMAYSSINGGASAAQGAKADTALQPTGSGASLTGVLKPADVVNSLTSTSTTAPLAAAQGPAIQGLLDGKVSGAITITSGYVEPSNPVAGDQHLSPISFVEYANNPILAPSFNGIDRDSVSTRDMSVFKLGDGTYGMAYLGFDTVDRHVPPDHGAALMYATAPTINGPWTKRGVVDITTGSGVDTYLSRRNVTDPYVLYDSTAGVWRMWGSAWPKYIASESNRLLKIDGLPWTSYWTASGSGGTAWTWGLNYTAGQVVYGINGVRYTCSASHTADLTNKPTGNTMDLYGNGAGQGTENLRAIAYWTAPGTANVFPMSGWTCNGLAVSALTTGWTSSRTGRASGVAAPEVVPNPAGGYVMFLCNWPYRNQDYRGGYATAASYDGPWTLADNPLTDTGVGGSQDEQINYFKYGSKHFFMANHLADTPEGTTFITSDGDRPATGVWAIRTDLWVADSILGPYTMAQKDIFNDVNNDAWKSGGGMTASVINTGTDLDTSDLEGVFAAIPSVVVGPTNKIGAFTIVPRPSTRVWDGIQWASQNTKSLGISDTTGGGYDPILKRLSRNIDYSSVSALNIPIANYIYGDTLRDVVFRANGTSNTPSATPTGASIRGIAGRIYDANGFSTANDVQINLAVDGVPSETSHPTKIGFYTTPAGSTTQIERVSINSGGQVASTLPTASGPPLVVASTSKVANLNVDWLDGADLDTDSSLSADSDTKIPSQKAVKAYVDASSGVWANTPSLLTIDTATDTGPEFNPAVLVFGDTNNERIEIRSSVQSQFQGKASAGTVDAPAATTTGKILVALAGSGYDGVEWSAYNPALIALRAESLWSVTSQPAYISLSTTPIDSTGLFRAERMRITGSGDVGIGTTAPEVVLDINSATGANLQLTYNDSNGSAANKVNFGTSSSGDLTITPSGGDVAVDGTLSAKAPEITKTASATLTTAELSGTNINNYGQTATTAIDLTSPAEVAGANFVLDVSTLTSGAGYIGFKASASRKIYLDGVAGSAGGGIKFDDQAIGSFAVCKTFRDGSDSGNYNWQCKAGSGTCVAY